MAKKRNLKNYLDALVDDEGLKTEVTITLTDRTLIKLIAALVGSGITIILIALTLKNTFPNRQLLRIEKSVQQLKIKQ